ncbi:hypothetical protein Tco_0961819 [Tanacetum coccineum]
MVALSDRHPRSKRKNLIIKSCGSWSGNILISHFVCTRISTDTGRHDVYLDVNKSWMGVNKLIVPLDWALSGLVPSCCVIYDLELLSMSFDFVFSSEIFKSLSFSLDRLCHLAIFCLDQHAHTLHHLKSLLTISLDRLDIFEGRSCISEFVWKSLSLILELS